MTEDCEVAITRAVICLEKVKLENAQLRALLKDVRHFVPAGFEELCNRMDDMLKEQP
jgi:hypothetical protein